MNGTTNGAGEPEDEHDVPQREPDEEEFTAPAEPPEPTSPPEPPVQPPGPYLSAYLPPLPAVLSTALDRAQRRADGIEQPVPLRWKILEEHFGGGLWPGFHILCSTTGIGKSAFALDQALYAAREGIPVAFVGLELRLDEAGMRVLGAHGGVPWSKLYTGQASPHDLDRARGAARALTAERVPLHIIPRRSQGWPASKLASVAEEMRKQYPETNGPGSRPILMFVDYLQLIGSEMVPCRWCLPCKAGNTHVCRKPVPDGLDIRERIARGSYTGHEVADHYGVAVLAISSVARAQYNLWKSVEGAELNLDVNNRGIANPDALVGMGKESGEIEYAADSVSVLVRVPDTWSDTGCEMLFATAKGRATGARWSPLRFTGFGYVNSADRGASVVAALTPEDEDEKEGKKDNTQTTRRQRRQKQVDAERDERKAKADAAKLEQTKNVEKEVVRVVIGQPGIGLADLRKRVASAIHCTEGRVAVVIAGCEDTQRIVVVRHNARDHRHYPAGWTPTEGATEEREREEIEIPPIPPCVGAGRATDGGSARETPATPAIPGKNKAEGVAGACAIPAIPPWEDP